jgi:hypothetical protein
MNATTTLPTTSIPRVPTFAHFSSSTSDHRVDLHLWNISSSCVGFKYMTRGFWQITPTLWTTEWTMTNKLKVNPMASIGLTGKWWIAL